MLYHSLVAQFTTLWPVGWTCLACLGHAEGTRTVFGHIEIYYTVNVYRQKYSFQKYFYYNTGMPNLLKSTGYLLA